jgi:hypothetical protein
MPFIAQHITFGPSNLPEDRFINFFAFAGAIEPAPVAAAVAIANALERFFTVEHGPVGFPITAFLPAGLGDTAEVRVYDVSDPLPREPQIITYPFPASGGTALPSEVAVCNSYFADRNLPRQRGRIFIGPVTTAAMGSGSPFPVRVKLEMRQSLAEASKDLVELGAGAGFNWCVRSQAGVGVTTFSPITDGWVDDAFDTQRRRGEKASTRNTWNAIPS